MTQFSAFLLNIGGQMRSGLAGVWQVLAGISWPVFLQRAIVQGVPLLYGSTGEILTEKSGNLNLGIPGIMYVGAISGVIGSFLYESSLPVSFTRDAPKKLPKPTPKVVRARPVTFWLARRETVRKQ